MAKKNTDVGPRSMGYGVVVNEQVKQAHQRLFGEGAKVSGTGKAFTTPDEKAMDLRPRASNAGKDISLPKEKAWASDVLDKEGRVKK